MKRSHLVLALLAVPTLGAAAAAQAGKPVTFGDGRDQTIDIDISGEIDLNWAYQDRVLREVTQEGVGVIRIFEGSARSFSGTGGWVTTAGGPTNPDSGDFFWGRLTLRVQAHVTDHVDGFLELETPNFDAGFITPIGGLSGDGLGVTSGLRPQIEQAYVDINALWDQHISVRLGLQDVVIDLRGPDRSGGAFVFDLTESESAWHGVNRVDGLTALAGVPVTFRETLDPIGLRFRWQSQEDHVDFKLWLLPVLGRESLGGDTVHESESLYLAALDWFLPPELGQGSKVMFLAGLMSGGNNKNTLGTAPFLNGLDGTGHDMNVWTFGVGLDLRGIGDPGLEIFSEIYFQMGDAGVAGAGTPNAGLDLDASGWAYNIGFRYEAPPDVMGHPWFEFAYVFLSGDETIAAGDDEYDGFISYENVDDFAIIEGNELGLDVDTGYSAFKIKGGVRLSSDTQPDAIHLDAKVGFFSFDEPQPLGAAAASDDLGTEIDVRLVYHFNKQLTFHILWASLSGATALEGFTAGAEDSTWLMNIGMNLKF
jgi:hypothetical protein